MTETRDRDGAAETPRRLRAPAPEKTWAEFLGVSGAVKIALITAAFVWFYWDHILRLNSFWKQPDWSHGYLIPVFSLYLVGHRKRAVMAAPQRGSLAGLGLMLLSMAAYVYFILVKMGTPQPLTMVPMIAGVVLLTWGWRMLWITAFPIGFLALAIPPPDRLYREIVQPLQGFAAAVSTAVLNTFPGAEVENSGISIDFIMQGGRMGTFTVAGACSGMRSLMAFVALGLMIAYLRDRATWLRVAMAVCGVPVALFCNCVRVIITGAFQMYGMGDLATGTPHALLGLGMFALGIGIYMGLLWVFEHLFEPVEGDAAGSAT